MCFVCLVAAFQYKCMSVYYFIIIETEKAHREERKHWHIAKSNLICHFSLPFHRFFLSVRSGASEHELLQVWLCSMRCCVCLLSECHRSWHHIFHLASGFDPSKTWRCRHMWETGLFASNLKSLSSNSYFCIEWDVPIDFVVGYIIITERIHIFSCVSCRKNRCVSLNSRFMLFLMNIFIRIAEYHILSRFMALAVRLILHWLQWPFTIL